MKRWGIERAILAFPPMRRPIVGNSNGLKPMGGERCIRPARPALVAAPSARTTKKSTASKPPWFDVDLLVHGDALLQNGVLSVVIAWRSVVPQVVAVFFSSRCVEKGTTVGGERHARSRARRPLGSRLRSTSRSTRADRRSWIAVAAATGRQAAIGAVAVVLHAALCGPISLPLASVGSPGCWRRLLGCLRRKSSTVRGRFCHGRRGWLARNMSTSGTACVAAEVAGLVNVNGSEFFWRRGYRGRGIRQVWRLASHSSPSVIRGAIRWKASRSSTLPLAPAPAY